MELRNLGRSGLKVSAVGLGCNNFGWRIDLKESQPVVDAAIDCGINFFDTANVYGQFKAASPGGYYGRSEEILGETLGARRKDVVVATKFGMAMPDGTQGASRSNIIHSVEQSLRRLGTDYIDLYQLHEADPATPIEETLRALDDLIRAGKVRYVGCSRMPTWEIARAQHLARELGTERFVSVQDELSILIRHNEADLLPALEAYEIGFLPFFPLASGLLTGKYKRGADLPKDSRFANFGRLADRYLNQANWDRTEALSLFCEERGKSLVELAFSWLLTRPTVSSVMAGATSAEQVRANAAATGWALSQDELDSLDTISGPEAG